VVSALGCRRDLDCGSTRRIDVIGLRLYAHVVQERKGLVGLFWLLFAVEVIGLLFLLLTPAGGGVGAPLFLFPPVAGLLAVLLGLLARPSRKFALGLLALHLLALGVVLSVPWYEQRQAAQARRAVEERAQAEQRALLQRAVVVRQLKSGQLGPALAYLAEHPQLRFEELGALGPVFCALGESPLDARLLAELQKRGARPGELLGAAAQCSVSAVRTLLDRGIAPDTTMADGRTALMVGEQLEALALLLERGAKVNARTPSGASALMFHRTPEVTAFLLGHGADLKARDAEGRGALHYAGPSAHLAGCYERLLEAGADPNLRGPAQYTPLIALAVHQDSSRFSQAAADMLVEHGADPMALEVNRRSALWYLIYHHVDIGPSLRWAGLKVDTPEGTDLLSAAIDSGDDKALALLLRAGFNPGATDLAGDRPLDLYWRRHGNRDDPRYRELERIASEKAPH
jgi:ankyrin repeat protein